MSSQRDCRYGFRVPGSYHEKRILIDAPRAFAGYVSCAKDADVGHESYLSAFSYPRAFRTFLQDNRSTAGYDGPCWSPWVWFDIDRECDLRRQATEDARRLVVALVTRYRVQDDELLVFFSGCKGYHVGLPTSLWLPEASTRFHRVARRFAEKAADFAGIDIDPAIYGKVQPLRAPNSRHPKTGLHKRYLTVEELMALTPEGIVRLAETPEPFDLPVVDRRSEQAEADWQEADKRIQSEVASRSVAPSRRDQLNRQTMEFIREGAHEGERARRLFSSAANLAEFGCPYPLAHALLTEAALDSGLPPSEVRRQIDCGLEHGRGGAAP